MKASWLTVFRAAACKLSRLPCASTCSATTMIRIVFHLVRRVWQNLSAIHTRTFCLGTIFFTVYNWSSPAQRPCHFLHEPCLAKTVVCAECLQLVEITTTLHRFSFVNLECYKPQDLIMLISFANTELIMAFASWKTSFRYILIHLHCEVLFAVDFSVGSCITSHFRLRLHYWVAILWQFKESVCVCVHMSAAEFHILYISGNLYFTHCGLGILWTATLLLSCKNILHARRWHGHNNHSSCIDGKLGATNSLEQNWTTQLPPYLIPQYRTAWIFPLYFQLPCLPEETCL